MSKEYECGVEGCDRSFDNAYSLARHEGRGHGEPWHDEGRLKKEYVENGKTTEELGEKWGCDPSAITYWLEQFGIDRRKTGDWQRQEFVSLWHTEQGYVYWKDHTPPSRGESFPVHRLLAISEFGIDAVKGMHVHHKNGCKFDNRSENIELVDPSEHVKTHLDEFERNDDGPGYYVSPTEKRVEELKNEVGQ